MSDSNLDIPKESVGFRPSAICVYGNTVILIFLSFYFFILPFFIIAYYLIDPNLKSGGIPRIVLHSHRSLTPKYEKWATERVNSGCAKELDIENIDGTEWPLFGSVFYLLATESIQEAWEKSKDHSSIAPKIYATGAIEAAAKLVADPGHASWVKIHWGQNYLHRENVFYRMLLISALTSYEKLVGDGKYISILRDQVETLSKELDDSPYGLLDDYPGQCYPTDIVAAIAAIKRADAVLGTDHSDFVRRSVRAFQGQFVDSTGLPPYEADSVNGIIRKARGCSSQWITVWAPDLWPEYAKQLYKNFEKHFWQKRWTVVGFREFIKDHPNGDWYIDVDSGPVIAGFGAAASAFGIGAARVNGRFDHAYPLTAEAIVLCWPLPDGTLGWPRFLSNGTHAPYLGETALLFSLSRMPSQHTQITPGDKLPFFVYVILVAYLVIGVTIIWVAVVNFKCRTIKISKKAILLEKTQLVIWVSLLMISIALLVTRNPAVGLILLLSIQLLPKGRPKSKCRPV
jgi:hypothetical protein